MVVAVIAACALAILGLPATASAASSSQTVTKEISATRPWIDTGVYLPKGSVSFKASGQINVYGGRTDSYKDPAGHGAVNNGCIASPTLLSGQWLGMGLPCWSLIGKIGDHGKPFEVGTASTHSVTESGELYLSVNDESVYSFVDNSGSWTVQISSTPATDKCSIDVRAVGFAYGHLGYFGDHLYVVYTDMTGAKYHYEALPNPYPWNPFHQGYIQTYQGTGAESKVGSIYAGPVTALSGSQACGKDNSGNPVPGFDPKVVSQGPHACFLDEMAKIDKEKIPYNWNTTNSNAFVHTILYNCGIKPVKPDVNTPGWGWFL